MKDLSPEELTSLATIYSVELSKKCTIKELQTYRSFFLAVSNNLLTIISERLNTNK